MRSDQIGDLVSENMREIPEATTSVRWGASGEKIELALLPVSDRFDVI
jgi:hypothetical protein